MFSAVMLDSKILYSTSAAIIGHLLEVGIKEINARNGQRKVRSVVREEMSTSLPVEFQRMFFPLETCV
jgi:hypothetical protein